MNLKELLLEVRNVIYNLLVLFDIRPGYLKSTDVLLSRCACLGNDVLKLLQSQKILRSLNVVNYQKFRLDGFIAAFTNKVKRFGFLSVYGHIPRRDIQLCISMQSNRLFLRKNFRPKYIFMDDFSELTDSKFRLSGDDYEFFCNVSDLDPKFRTSNRLENLGLIENEKLTQVYDNFFEICFSRWPDTHILFMHFPTKLDSRCLYRERGQNIRDSIHLLTSKYSRLFAFDCPEALVHNGGEIDATAFPYHYSQAVYNWFTSQLAQKIRSIEE